MKHIAITITGILLISAFLFSIVWNSQVSPANEEKSAHLAAPLERNLSQKDMMTLQPETSALLTEMTLNQKISQMLYIGIGGTTLSPSERQMISEGEVGGVILLGRNVKSDQQLHQLVASIKQANQHSDIPLFIGVDEEGGRVSRIPAIMTNLPSSEKIGTTNDPGLANQVGHLLAKKVEHYGINMNFAPVLDISNNPDNEVIGDRSFGNTPEIVASLGTAVMKGIQQEGIIPVVKHFPGHGGTSADSHYNLPVLHKTSSKLETFEWVPFQRAIKSGAEAVMTAHILFPEIDATYPATLSKKIITGVLRKQLQFDGLILTDDMAMGAIANNYGMEEAAQLSIQAGTDMVLLTDTRNGNFTTVREALVNAVKSGKISTESVNQSVERILQLKKKYDLEAKNDERIKHEQLNERIADVWNKIK